MRLTHLSRNTLCLEDLTAFEQTEPFSFIDKPQGFWVSVDEGWENWTLRNEATWHYGNVQHEIELIEIPNVLIIENEMEFDAFNSEWGVDFGRKKNGLMNLSGSNIDWQALAEKYDGVIIAEHFWSRRRIGGQAPWYNTWDCASGCIWNPRAIKSVTAGKML